MNLREAYQYVSAGAWYQSPMAHRTTDITSKLIARPIANDLLQKTQIEVQKLRKLTKTHNSCILEIIRYSAIPKLDKYCRGKRTKNALRTAELAK